MQHLKSIHYLRAIAAIMVVIFHIFSNIEFMRPNVEKVYWLRGGVDIFFVISGYVMVKSTENRDISPAYFIVQRAKRIVPMYWIATFATITMMQVDGQWNFKLMSFLFIPAMHPDFPLMQPIVEPGWTLNYEMFFYAIFALSLLTQQAHRFAAIAFSFTLLVLLGLTSEWPDIFEFYSRPIIIEFLLGMALANYKIKMPMIAAPIGFFLMFGMQSLQLERVFSLGLPAMLIVSGSLSTEKHLPHWKIANLLGSASYSIYLFHLLALGLVLHFFTYTGLNNSMFAGASMIFILVSGCAFYWILERPIIAYFSKSKTYQTEQHVAQT
jgi:exopolysaccharide production protein ExoZ